MSTEAVSTGEPVRDAFHEAYSAALATHTPSAHGDGDSGEEGHEQGAGDAEAEPAETATPTKEAKATTAADPALITDDEFAALQAKHGDDPAALKRDLQKAFTQKTQALAEQRKSVERLSQYAPLIESFESDREGTLRRLAEQEGFTIAPKGATATGQETPSETSEAVESVLDEFRKELGPEVEYLADALAPAITKLVERLTQSTIAPIKAQTATLVEKVAQEKTDVVMKAFGEQHPDWQEHEAAMFALSQQLEPKGMTEGQFLEHLYTIASAKANNKDAREAAIETEVAARLKKQIAKMNGATSEAPSKHTPESQVRKRPSGPVDFAQAAQDAMNGIKYDD